MLPLALPLIQAGAGLLQSIIGGGKARKAQKQLERLDTPTYTQNQSVLDYYNKALQRANVNPYESTMYKMQQQNIGRNQNTALAAAGDRRSGLGAVSNLVRGSNDASLRAGVAAEQEQGQRFNQLGSATGMKSAEDMKAFQYNKIAPYEKKYNLLAMKAAGNNQTSQAGLQNMFGGLQSASMIGAGMSNPFTSQGSAYSPMQTGSNSDGSPNFGYSSQRPNYTPIR